MYAAVQFGSSMGRLKNNSPPLKSFMTLLHYSLLYSCNRDPVADREICCWSCNLLLSCN